MIRAARVLIYILAILVLTSLCASAEYTPARVLIGAREATIAPRAVFDGKKVYAPVALLDYLDVGYLVTEDKSTVALTGRNGKSGSIVTHNISETRMVAVDDVLAIIGGESRWDPKLNTLTLHAHLQSVQFKDGVLHMGCSFPVAVKLHYWDKKLIAKLPHTLPVTEAKEVSVGDGDVIRARIGATGDTANVVLDLNRPIGCELVSQPVASIVKVKTGADLPLPDSSIEDEKEEKTGQQPFNVHRMVFENIDSASFNIVLFTSNSATLKSSYSVGPSRVRIRLVDGNILEGASLGEPEHPLLAGPVRFAHNASGTEIDITTTRIVAYSAMVEDDRTIISVRLPERSGGSLADKIIVLDPGHGGPQPGAKIGKLTEKELNDKIVAQLKKDLESHGATVILTRNEDIKMGLAERGQVAIDNYADFFISVHCNSNIRKNSATGIETYYHMIEPSPRAFAYAVHYGVCGATGMCDRYARSDRTLYSKGLGVLRSLSNTGIPAVLLECGYMNHDSDRTKLLSAKYREKVSLGVIKGLKAYIAGNTLN